MRLSSAAAEQAPLTPGHAHILQASKCIYNISIFQRNNAGGHLSFTHSKASPGRLEPPLITLQGASHSSHSASLMLTRAVCFKSPRPTVCVVLVPRPCAGRGVCLHSLYGTSGGIFDPPEECLFSETHPSTFFLDIFSYLLTK